MTYVLALLWICAISGAGLAIWLIHELTTPNEWASIEEHAAITDALRPGGRR